MKNRYRGVCRKCKLIVEIGDGTVQRVDGKSVVQHDDCRDGEKDPRWANNTHPFDMDDDF